MLEKTQPDLQPLPGKAKQLAKIISDSINPIVSGFFMAGFLTFRVIESPIEALKWFGLTALLTTLPPVVYVFYLLRTGDVTDIYMPKREERLKPLLFTFVWLIISIIILNSFQAPFSMTLLVGIALFQVVLLGLITVQWKISFHSATIMSAATITIMLRSNLAWFFLPLVLLVGWSRVHLQRHTLMQVFAGYVAGVVIAATGVYLIGYYFPFRLGD